LKGREKEGRICALAGKMCVSLWMVNWPLMAVLLSMKNMAKS